MLEARGFVEEVVLIDRNKWLGVSIKVPLHFLKIIIMLWLTLI